MLIWWNRYRAEGPLLSPAERAGGPTSLPAPHWAHPPSASKCLLGTSCLSTPTELEKAGFYLLWSINSPSPHFSQRGAIPNPPALPVPSHCAL